MKTKFLMLSFLVFFASCAAFGPKVNREESAKVQKVAIIALEVQQQLPTDNTGIGAIMQLSKDKLRQDRQKSFRPWQKHH